MVQIKLLAGTHAMSAPPLPHEGVLVRLDVSPIHGIGVFAGQDIPAGRNVFPNDRRAIRWVSAAAVAESQPSGFERRFYEDFAIRRGGEYGCPDHFDLLGPGWYVNRPAAGTTANLYATPAFDMIAARDIAAGEELTIDYASFSDG